MIDPELEAKLEEIRLLAEHAAKSAEKVRRYIVMTAVISVALVVIPLIGLAFFIPTFLNTTVLQYQSLLNSTP